MKITLQYKVFVLHTASWTAVSDREAPPLRQNAAPISEGPLLILYSEGNPRLMLILYQAEIEMYF